MTTLAPPSSESLRSAAGSGSWTPGAAGASGSLPTQLGALALAAGALWAAASVAWGASPSQAGLLIGPASLSQWAGLLAADVSVQRPHLAARVAFATALVLLFSVLLGQLLGSYTNHRPLGAVTWVLILGGVSALAFACAHRVSPEPWLGAAVLGSALGFALVRSLPVSAANLAVGAEFLVGLGLLGASLLVRRRMPAAMARFGGVALLLAVAVSLYAVIGREASSLHQVAPITAGWVGLIH